MNETSAARATAILISNVRLGPHGPLGSVLTRGDRVADVSLDPAPDGAHDVFDGRGRTVLPGMWDAHVHMVQWTSARRRVDLTGATSAQHAAALMAAAPDGTGPLIGYGFRDALWPDHAEPGLLDWAGERPVALVSNDLHTAWLNQAALALVDRAGHPTGVLREHDSLDAAERLALAPTDTVDEWISEATVAAAARGITGFADFEHADNITDWTRRAQHHRPATRVSCTIYPQFLEAAIARGLRTGDPVPGAGDLITVGPLKVFVDGSLNARTALCNDPYATPADGAPAQGLLVTEPAELRALMRRAWANGIQTAVHAIGDRANTIALDAFEEIGCPGRIEHAQLIDRRDLRRVALPGLVLGVQPAHVPDDRDVADQHWEGRTDRAFAYADLLAAGAQLEIGSDAPVSAMDPWLGIAAAVHRTADDRDGWHPEQAIPLQRALAAAAGGRDRIRPGDPADLVVVEADPAEVPPAELRAMPVVATMTAGRWTHRSA